MRYIYLISILLLAFIPSRGFADVDDQDLGPAIYLNNAPDNKQIDNDWDDGATSNNNTKANNFFTVTPPKNNVIAKKPAAEIQTYGPTKSYEHIWSLAEKLRPNISVTVQQMIIALQQANPNAFDQGNINALKNGSILRIPTLDKIQAISAAAAKFLVEQQNQRWQQIQNANMYFKVGVADVSLTSRDVPITNTQSSTTPTKPLVVMDQKNSSPVIVAPKQATAIANMSFTKPVSPVAKPMPPISAVLPKQQQTLVTKVAMPKPVPVTAPENTAVITNLEKEIANEQKDFQNYREQTTKQLVEVEQKNSALEKELVIDNKAIASLKKTVNANQANVNVLPIPNNSESTGIISYLPQTKTGWWILWGAVFLIVLLWLPSPKKKKVKVTAERQEPTMQNNEESGDQHDIKDEYDFMNSQEAIPAKFDLARAYIDMEDLSSAENVLKEIVKNGNTAERKRARQMLREVKVEH